MNKFSLYKMFQEIKPCIHLLAMESLLIIILLLFFPE